MCMGSCRPVNGSLYTESRESNGFRFIAKVTSDGSKWKEKLDLYTLRNKNNMEVCITNFGGRIVSVMVPTKTDRCVM